MKSSKKHLLKLVFLLVGIEMLMGICIAQSPSFESYLNPVIPGDHPDATLTRIGNDFYTTGSSFNVTPIIYHSTDLVHWEPIAQPVKASWSNYEDKAGGGCWGGHIVYYNGKYWDYFSRSNTMYFVTADNPAGPWSEPVMVNNPSSLSYTLGYDNSIFIDDDNKWYLIVKNGQPNNAIIELGNDGQPAGAIYNLSWLNPAAENYPYSWAEGPVMWKYGDYYYYSFAYDLSGGQKVMRSTTLTADESSWEMLGDFFNENDPLKPGALFTSPNHASPAIMLDDSTSWVIHPLYAKGEWKGQGRQGLLNQVRYDVNLKPVGDYPTNRTFTAPNLPSSGIPWMVPKSDFFNSDVLNPEWCFLGFTPDNKFSLTERLGWLRLSPKSSVKANTVIKNDGEHNYSLITRLEFDAKSTNDKAGLRIMRGDETSFVKLYSSLNEYEHKTIVFSFNSLMYEVDNTIGNILWLKLVRVNHSISGYYSANGIDWKQIGNSFTITSIDSYSDFATYTGTRQGLFTEGSDAYFDMYIYRDAYTPILAECPANYSGTYSTSKSEGIYQLDSIHNNDWALYAGVEFGNREYLKVPKTIEITASSAGAGGTVEVWLDSIDSGAKVAECVISSTGDWNTFNTFSAPVDSIQGRHDVYLRYTGAGTERLFKLKWIQFIAETGPEYVSASINNPDTIRLKLNQPVILPTLPCGLNILANGSQSIAISGIKLAEGDSSLLVITIGSSILNTDQISISYDSGSIANPNGIGLAPFNNFIANNQLPGAIPVINLLETRNMGDTIWMHLSKKMNSPASYINDFKITIEGKENINIKSARLLENDSTTIILLPENRVYYEDKVALTYSGTSLGSVNGGYLNAFSSMAVQNTTNGYPPNITDASIRGDGSIYYYIDLTFDKQMFAVSGQKDFFTITLDDIPTTISNLAFDYDSLSFSISPGIEYNNQIKISYAGGNVKSLHNGKLEDFSDFIITNTIPASGIDEKSSDVSPGVIIFPNPAKHEIKVISEFLFNKITLSGLDGKILFQEEYNSPLLTTTILLNLKAGIYTVMLQNENVSNFQQLIIE